MIAPKMPSRPLAISDISTRIVPVQKAFSLITRRATKTDGPRIQAKSEPPIPLPTKLESSADLRQPRCPRILFRINAIPLADRAVPVVDLTRRVGRLNRREQLEDFVRMPGVPGNDPRVARFQQAHLALAVQVGASGDDVAHRLVVPCDLRLRRPRRLVTPQPHPHPDPRRQVKLAQRALGRVRAVDL